MNYGELPNFIDTISVSCNEMMFYQYLPIKMANKLEMGIRVEPRLKCFEKLIGRIACDYVGFRGLNRFVESYMYMTCKHMWQPIGESFNRKGWHSDSFMTEEVNYLWSDKNPTVFNTSNFILPQDDQLALEEMTRQAWPKNDVSYPNNSLLRLTQYNIHRVGDAVEAGMRTFVKVSFSPDKYNLVGNSHNYEFDYDWPMQPRTVERNIPTAGEN